MPPSKRLSYLCYMVQTHRLNCVSHWRANRSVSDDLYSTVKALYLKVPVNLFKGWEVFRLSFYIPYTSLPFNVHDKLQKCLAILYHFEMLVKEILAAFIIAGLATATSARDINARASQGFCPPEGPGSQKSDHAWCCATAESLKIFFIRGAGSGCVPGKEFLLGISRKNIISWAWIHIDIRISRGWSCWLSLSRSRKAEFPLLCRQPDCGK